MSHYLAAGVYAVFLWWFSTGVIFFLNARAPATFRWSMLGGTILLLGALYGLWVTSRLETPLGAFAGFTFGLVIWGWHTMSYYMGVVTGPRRSACPSNCRGWRHFVHAVQTSIYHELAIIATAVVLAAMTLDAPNRYGLWTFLVLWAMHVSAKLNVFLGVRNLNKEFIPDHLQYLTRFFRRRPMNLLFPVSVTAGTVVTLMLAHTANTAEAGTLVAAGHTLLATIMALAVLEHWFMMLPIPADALWRWSIEPGPTARKTRSASTAPNRENTANRNARDKVALVESRQPLADSGSVRGLSSHGLARPEFRSSVSDSASAVPRRH